MTSRPSTPRTPAAPAWGRTQTGIPTPTCAPGARHATPSGARGAALPATALLAIVLPLLAAALTPAGLRGQEAGGDAGFTADLPATEGVPRAGLASRLATALAQAYDRAVFPPGPVALTWEECPGAGARHELVGEERAGARVVLCVDLLENAARELEAAGIDEALRDSVLEAVGYFAYAHQTGHAVGELPRPGPADATEESADQFTALTFLSRPRLARHAVLYWRRDPVGLAGEARSLVESLPDETPAYAAEHRLDRVRLADLMCRVYGARPRERGWIVEDSLVSRVQAQRCPKAFRDLWNRWGSLFHRPVTLPEELPEAPPREEPADGEGETPAEGAPAEEEPGGEEPRDGDRRPGEAEEERRPLDRTPEGDAQEAPAWGEAEALWTPYRVRVGDVLAPILADVLHAEDRLPERVVVTYEPHPGTLDIEIYGEGISTSQAREVVEDYWDFVRKQFLPFVERRYGPELSERDFRILYYDASGDDLRTVVGRFRGQWVQPQ